MPFSFPNLSSRVLVCLLLCHRVFTFHFINMVETGKRPLARDGNRDRERDRDRDHDNDRRNQKRRINDKESSREAEIVIYRILCPKSVIGSVIGKSGKVINSLRQDTNAKIKVVDPYPGSDKRVILVYCYVKNREYVDSEKDFKVLEPLCPAQDALIKVHETIVNAFANTEDHNGNNKEEAELLVPSSQSSALIGKSGANIKRLRSQTRANIKVSPKEANNPSHSCAMSFDNFVQIIGDAEAVKKALYHVSSILYNYPPKEDISLETTVPELPHNIIIPSDPPIYPSGSLYSGPEAMLPPIIGLNPHQSDVRGYDDTYGGLPVYVPNYGIPECSGELVVRVLCPSDRIGRVIGRGGSVIKGIRQDSGANIDVKDSKRKDEDCVITITSKESTNDDKSASVEAILLLQENINDKDDEPVAIHLLVPSSAIGCLIGKNGTIISDMRKRTKAKIYISKGEKPKCAGPGDEFVEVSGDVGNVRDALVQIVLRLREEVLKERDANENKYDDSAYSASLSRPSVLSAIPQAVTPLSYDVRAETGRGLELLPSSSMYGYSSLQAGESEYEPISPYGSKSYGGRGSTMSEVVIPSHALSKVLGRNGANLTNIRNLSGADIEIVDSRSSRYEHIAQISGTHEQKRSAENMIQAFILST